MRNIIRCNDTLPKMLDSNLCMLSIVFCLLATVLILGTIFPVVMSSILSIAYAALPTERDPDIDVETVRLGKGSIAAGGIRILADVDPFFIIDGHVEFNAPTNARDIKVVVAESTRKSITHAVILNPTKLKDIKTGEALYHVDLNQEISGKNPWTGDSDKVDDYNNVYLMNVGRGKGPISFNDQSQATITLVFAG
ncbi:MAG: hypothetical protein WAM54_12680 [Nitrososphaeraceae archaeon]